MNYIDSFHPLPSSLSRFLAMLELKEMLQLISMLKILQISYLKVLASTTVSVQTAFEEAGETARNVLAKVMGQ